MYCLYESINEHNADIDIFVHALAMFWDQNQKNRSKIDDVIILQNLDTKLKKNVNNFQNTWNFENSIQTKMS